MNDQNIPADKVRKIVKDMRRHADHDAVRGREEEYVGQFADLLEALLPSPPTLADMNEEERAACLRMQCDTAPNRSVRGFIADIYPGGCRVIERDTWEWRSCSDDMVTPRPDLPRLEWPGDTTTGPGIPAVGTVIESADDPRIDALPVGSILLGWDEEASTKRRWAWTGRGCAPIPSQGAKFGPWTVLHIPKEADQ